MSKDKWTDAQGLLSLAIKLLRAVEMGRTRSVSFLRALAELGSIEVGDDNGRGGEQEGESKGEMEREVGECNCDTQCGRRDERVVCAPGFSFLAHRTFLGQLCLDGSLLLARARGCVVRVGGQWWEASEDWDIPSLWLLWAPVVCVVGVGLAVSRSSPADVGGMDERWRKERWSEIWYSDGWWVVGVQCGFSTHRRGCATDSAAAPQRKRTEAQTSPG